MVIKMIPYNLGQLTKMSKMRLHEKNIAPTIAVQKRKKKKERKAKKTSKQNIA